MKIHILYNFQKSPWGGGNQFLEALRKEFEKQDVYEQNSEKADVILFNSHHNFNKVFNFKKRFKNKIFIHRIDGPVYLIRGTNKDLDKIIYKFNELIADGIVFQSNWSKTQNNKSFKILCKYQTIIHNASDKKIFNKDNKKTFNPDKIKLIVNSWSSNLRKGFDIYKFLDENLDFSKYEMCFIGNSPVEFKNIKYIKPVCSEELAKFLKEHDVYITASQNDPCSNSLIEALSCGLPAVARNNGGHPELVKNGGELFEGKQDIIEKIEKVAKNYSYYQSQIPEFSIKKIAQFYYKFAERIYDDVQNKQYKSKQVSFSTEINFCKMKYMILKWRVFNKIKKVCRI